jgi:hypothetical protein
MDGRDRETEIADLRQQLSALEAERMALVYEEQLRNLAADAGGTS